MQGNILTDFQRCWKEAVSWLNLWIVEVVQVLHSDCFRIWISIQKCWRTGTAFSRALPATTAQNSKKQLITQHYFWIPVSHNCTNINFKSQKGKGWLILHEYLNKAAMKLIYVNNLNSLDLHFNFKLQRANLASSMFAKSFQL